MSHPESGKNLSGSLSQDTPKQITQRSFHPLRINADEQSKWSLTMKICLAILSILFWSIISAFVLPGALVSVNNEWSCETHLQLANNTVSCADSSTNYTTMGTVVANLSPLNQFLVLYLAIKPETFSLNANLNEVINFTLYSAKRIMNGTNTLMKVIGKSSATNVMLNGLVKDLFKDHQFFLLYMTKLSASDEFYWELSFDNNTQFRPGTYYLNSQIVNPNFSYFAIFLRVGLFLVSILVFFKYNKTINGLPKELISVEQKVVQVLSLITLTFNDQFYFISIIAPNPFSSFLSSFFLWNFVAYLFILWALFLNRIRAYQPENSTNLISIPMGIIFFVFYAIILAYSASYAITQTTEHPVFSFEDINTTGVFVMKILAFIAFSLGCAYIIYLYFYILKCKPIRAYRHNIFMVISAAFFISTIVFFFVGGYDLYSYSGSKILFTLCFMNMYSFFLQYLYSPTQKQVKDLLKDISERTSEKSVEAKFEDSEKSNEGKEYKEKGTI